MQAHATFPVRVTPVAAQRTEVNAVDDDAAPELDDGETSIGVQGALDVAVSGGCTARGMVGVCRSRRES